MTHQIACRRVAALNDTYTKFRGPVNLLVSMPPKVSSPFVLFSVVVGSNEIPNMCAGMSPAVKALSVTVGTQAVNIGMSVPTQPRVSLVLACSCITYRMSDRQVRSYERVVREAHGCKSLDRPKDTIDLCESLRKLRRSKGLLLNNEPIGQGDIVNILLSYAHL